MKSPSERVLLKQVRGSQDGGPRSSHEGGFKFSGSKKGVTESANRKKQTVPSLKLGGQLGLAALKEDRSSREAQMNDTSARRKTATARTANNTRPGSLQRQGSQPSKFVATEGRKQESA